MGKTTSNTTVNAFEKSLFGQSVAELAESLQGDERLLRTWALIKHRYADQNLRLEQAAREAGASVAWLTTHMRLHCKFTFGQLLRRYRVCVAVKLLTNTRASVLQASLDSGFGSVRSLERNFNSLLGFAPKAIVRGGGNSRPEWSRGFYSDRADL